MSTRTNTADRIRWGILGTGAIAHQFARALNSLPDAEIAAVGSRSHAAADAFAREFGIPRAYGSYSRLAADAGVDIVYIATPHAMHRDNSALCLEQGKAVLCEKPFAINRAQADDVIQLARARRLFVMEAMWTRFLPAVRKATRWIAEGAIGDVRMVQASFGFRDDSPALFDPRLGGGSLLDVGVYPITLAHLAFGSSPDRIQSLATLGRNGVDEQAGILLGFPGGGIAVLSSAIQTETPQDAYILGTAGKIQLHAPFWAATRVSHVPEHGAPETLDFPHSCNGYEYEAIEAQRCVREGRIESELMPHDTTLKIMDTLDTLRRQWGLIYPMETK